jgi:hypothetical protein
VKELADDDIQVYFGGAHGSIYDDDKSGLLAPLARERAFPTMEEAVRHAEGAV